MWIWPFWRVDGVVFVFCTKFGSNICYSHWDRHTHTSDNHLMTSRELTSVFDFWSRDHLRMASVHLPMKFGAHIFIQSKVIDIFPKFKMAAAAIVDFQFMWIWPFRRVDSVVFVFCTKFGSNMCYSHWDRHTGSLKISRRNPCSPFLSASLYFSKRGTYWDRLCRDVVGRWSLVGCHACALWPNCAS